jgi:uncharacterized protein
MIRPVQMLIGSVALAVLAIVLIPVPKPSPDFAQTGGREKASGATGRDAIEATLRDTRWYELMPKDWDPYQQVRKMQKDARIVRDGDPRADEMIKKMRDLWDNAPVNTAMDGAAVRIPGYVVALGESKRGLSEFLLVPYFGACIHSPPPPSNQIIHVVPRVPVTGVRSMDGVWIGGVLKVKRSDSPMGVSSYRMDAVEVEPYVPPKRD